MRLFILAGEPSGDALGGALMAALKAQAPGLAFEGVGGAAMQAEGLQSLFPMEELSVFGLAEVLPRYFALRRRLKEAAEAVLDCAADALITIDSPDFSLRLARIVKAARPGLPVIHYVAPSVWAWRPGRAARMAEVVDHVLALLPFEPPLMQAAGMSCDFVGHPVVAAPRAARKTPRLPQKARAERLLLLPGSRPGEIARLAPLMGQVLEGLLPQAPGLRVQVPSLPHLVPLLAPHLRAWPGSPELITEGPARAEAFAEADLALAASGTVSLELAAHGVPMVIAYKTHPLTMWLMRKMALTDTVTLVNLVSETRVVPEFLGREATPEAILPALLGLMEHSPARQAQLAAMDLCLARLGAGAPESPAARAARSVLEFLTREDGLEEPPA